MTLFFVWCVAL